VDNLGRVGTGIDVNQVVMTLGRCAVKRTQWASRRGLQIDTAKMKPAQITRRPGHKKHLWLKLTLKKKVGNRFIRFIKQPTCRMGVWREVHLTFK